MLVARGGEGVIDVTARRRRAVTGAEDLRDDIREDVGRAAEAIDAGRVDGEVEGDTPALTPQLRLDHPVYGIDLVIGLVVDVAQPAKRFHGFLHAIEGQSQLRHVEGSEDVLGPVRDDLSPDA